MSIAALAEHFQKRIRVVLVDEHTLFREGLRCALGRDLSIIVVAEAADGLHGQEAAVANEADVVLMALALPIIGGLEATRQLQLTHPHIRVIVVSQHTDEGNVLQAMRAGARGYFPKTASVSTICRAIRLVADGQSVIDFSLTETVLSEFRRLSNTSKSDGFGGLNKGEMAMLAHVAAGRSNKEIALRMHLVESTTKNRLTQIYKTIHVFDRTQAAIYALRHGIVPATDDYPEAA